MIPALRSRDKRFDRVSRGGAHVARLLAAHRATEGNAS